MIRPEWFRPKKLRVLMAWLGAPLLIFYSNISDASYLWGALLMVLGEGVRLGALCFVDRKGAQLSMSGPYALTRNPLYVGNFLLGLGVIVICANWILAVIFLAGFTIMYLGTIRNEETELQGRFGAVYGDYCKNVPRFFPRLTPYQAPEKTSFDWKRIFRHHEYVTVLGVALLLCAIRLYTGIFLKKEAASTQMGLIVFSSLIVALLIFERWFISDFKRMFAEGLPNLFHKKRP